MRSSSLTVAVISDMCKLTSMTITSSVCSVLEYVEGKWVFEGSGPTGGLGEIKAQKYLRDIVSGLMYLHAHV